MYTSLLKHLPAPPLLTSCLLQAMWVPTTYRLLPSIHYLRSTTCDLVSAVYCYSLFWYRRHELTVRVAAEETSTRNQGPWYAQEGLNFVSFLLQKTGMQMAKKPKVPLSNTSGFLSSIRCVLSFHGKLCNQWDSWLDEFPVARSIETWLASKMSRLLQTLASLHFQVRSGGCRGLDPNVTGTAKKCKPSVVLQFGLLYESDIYRHLLMVLLCGAVCWFSVSSFLCLYLSAVGF